MVMLNQYQNKAEVYNSYKKYQDDLGLALTRCGSPGRINELRTIVLCLQEKIKQLENLEKESNKKDFNLRND
jgi:hypothetical protein